MTLLPRFLRALELELCCMPIRRNEVPPEVRSIAAAYIEKGVPRMLRAFRPSVPRPDDRSLTMAHEYMVQTGSYRSCVEPLREALERTQDGSPTAEYLLAKAGIASIEHGLPFDLGPISAGLGLDRPGRGRFARGKGDDPLVLVMKEILRALLLEERSSYVESEGLARGLARGSDKAFSTAISSAADLAALDPELGVYHGIRCQLMMGRVLTRSGDQDGGLTALMRAAERAEKGRFPALEMSALIDLGSLSETYEEARGLLDKASEIASSLGNDVEAARSRIILARIANREAGSSPEERSMTDARCRSMIADSRTLDRDDPHFAKETRAVSALWMARIGDGNAAIKVLRRVLKELSSEPDEGLEMLVLASGVLAHMKRGDRKAAKRALLNLISKKPIKNDPEAYSVLREAVSQEMWLREDKETAELFAEEPVYLLERSAADEIIRRAKEAYPNEFGAMLRGIQRITHIEPVIEGAEGRSSFMFSMFNRFSQRMVEGEGVVHSHPSGAAYPSGADLAMFRTFPGINIIIGYPFSDDSMAAYDRLGNRVALRIVPDYDGDSPVRPGRYRGPS